MQTDAVSRHQLAAGVCPPSASKRIVRQTEVNHTNELVDMSIEPLAPSEVDSTYLVSIHTIHGNRTLPNGNNESPTCLEKALEAQQD